MVAFLEDLRGEMARAVSSVVHAEVDYLVMGMSAETFWGGATGAADFIKFMQTLSGGLGVTTGADACGNVMKVYGAKRIGIITPYQPVGDEQVVNFFTQIGCEVASIYGMKCATATSISMVSAEEIKDAFRKVDGPDVDLLIQAGTNLVAGKAAAEMEVELGKPVIAINTATVWCVFSFFYFCGCIGAINANTTQARLPNEWYHGPDQWLGIAIRKALGILSGPLQESI